MACSSILLDWYQIGAPTPAVSNISRVDDLMPSAWPRGVVHGFFSTRQTLIFEWRNQFASANLDKLSAQHGASHGVIYPDGPAPTMSTSTSSTSTSDDDSEAGIVPGSPWCQTGEGCRGRSMKPSYQRNAATLTESEVELSLIVFNAGCQKKRTLALVREDGGVRRLR